MKLVLSVTCGLLFVTVQATFVCDEEWHKHIAKCYWFSDFNTTRDDAKFECEARNSSLVTLNTTNSNNFIQKHMISNASYWIGLKIYGTPSDKMDWKWSYEEQLSRIYMFRDWCSNHNIGAACAAATYSGSNPPHICYESYNCGDRQRYVCEKEKLSACPEGWEENKYETRTKCYFISVEKLSNMDAARFCWSMSARLITITYAGPNNYLTRNRPGPYEVYWIGLTPYTWDDGTPYNWNNWDSSGPNIGAHCTLLQQDGTWHYGPCSGDMHYFICQKDATMSTATTIATTTTSTIAQTETTSPETTLFKSSDIPSTRSVSMMSNTSLQITVYTTYSSAIANNSSYMEMPVGNTSPTSESKLALYLMIGIYSAVGVVFVVFVGLLATCLVLRKRHISRMKNKSIEQETQFSEIAPHVGDVEYIGLYDSQKMVQIDDSQLSQSSPSVDIAHNAMTNKEQINDTSSSTIEEANGQETVARTISPSTKSITIDDGITGHTNNNGEQPQPVVSEPAVSAAGMAHTSVSPRHVLKNGEVYAEVDMSRKTIGYDDVILPQTATNDHCEQSASSEILSPTCNQDANEPPDVEDTSENVYYNESAQPIYSNEDSDHDLNNQNDNAAADDADHYVNGEDTYGNCDEEDGGLTYTEVDLPESKSHSPAAEEMVVYSDIKI